LGDAKQELRQMSFMEIETIGKGATYSAECSKCGATMFTQEWVYDDHNERRDAMENGTLRCDECNGRADPDTFTKERDQYAWLTSLRSIIALSSP
jgi:hypothetical protein